MDLLPAGTELAAGTLHLPNTEDVAAHAADIHARETVALHFPAWTDGRAYSQAVLLRARLHYRGRIIATGDVVLDMLPLLARCGFDGARLRADQRIRSAPKVLAQIEGHYQRTLAERAEAVPAPG